MAQPISQNSFAAGELSPLMYGRVDLDHYAIGCALAKNLFVDYHGGLSNRPGTAFMQTAKHADKKAVLIPFAFSTVQTYALEFGDQYMRVYMDGGAVLESNIAISGITQANPAKVTTSTAHGYSTGDEVYVSGVSGMTSINGGPYTITVTSTTEFTLDGIDSSGFDAYSSGGNVARIFEIATPYVEADLQRLKYTQSADVLTITHPDYSQREVTRTGHASWTISTITFANNVTAPSGLSTTASGFASNNHTVEYKVAAVVDGEESLPSSAVSATVDWSWPADGRVQITWTAVSGVTKYVVYANKNGFYGFIGEATSEEFYDDNIKADVTDAPVDDRDPFSGADDKPQCVTYHDQRIVYGGSNNRPAGVDLSKTGFFKNFARSVPPKADDAIAHLIVSREVNEIRHLLSLGALIALTSGGEWILNKGNEAVLTPSTIGSEAQSYNGASHVMPLVIGNNALFVQDGGRTVRDLAYSLNDDGFVGTDLTVRATHLFRDREIIDWTFAKEPYRIVWCVTDDGGLYSLTYVREQQVWAWTRHETDGYFESITSIREGRNDAVYLIVRRTVGGSTVRHVERMDNRDFTEIRDAFFVDSGLTFDGRNTDDTVTLELTGGSTWEYYEDVTLTISGSTLPETVAGDEYRLRREGESIRVTVISRDSSTTATVRLEADAPTELQAQTTSDWDRAVDAFSGLDHLEGEDVAILADGNVEPETTVSGGAITLDHTAAVVHAGLGYNADFKALDLEFGQETVRTRAKLTGKVSLFVTDTRGMYVGESVDDLVEIKPTLPEEYAEPMPLSDAEIIEAEVAGSWSKQAGVYARQVDPLPVTLLSAIPEVTFGGK